MLRQIEQQRSRRQHRSEFSDEGLNRLTAILTEIDAELQGGTSIRD